MTEETSNAACPHTKLLRLYTGDGTPIDFCPVCGLNNIVAQGLLGRFGHHPDPANDFCVEVEAIEGEAKNYRIGFQPQSRAALLDRINRAMTFNVGGDEIAVSAKNALREIERSLLATDAQEVLTVENVRQLAGRFETYAGDQIACKRFSRSKAEHQRAEIRADIWNRAAEELKQIATVMERAGK
jgi:hypothetical protein